MNNLPKTCFVFWSINILYGRKVVAFAVAPFLRVRLFIGAPKFPFVGFFEFTTCSN